MKYNFLDLFAGVGGFRLGLEEAGHTCAGYIEKDKHARRSYEAIFDTEGEWTAWDIIEVTDDEIRDFGRSREIGIICGGFPCQPFSKNGKRQARADARGNLFKEIVRFAAILKPKFLFLENVPGLHSSEDGETFAVILSDLEKLGYFVEWKVINSQNYSAQNRDRLFIIGHLGTGGPGEREILSDFPTSRKPASRRGGTEKEPLIAVREATKKGYALAGAYDVVNVAVPTSKTRRGRVASGYANTLETSVNQAVVMPDGRLRYLTPRESWRLQTFPDWAYDRAAAVCSERQLYRQAGNAVTVSLIREIGKKFY